MSRGTEAESCASLGTSGGSDLDTPFPSLCLTVSKCKRRDSWPRAFLFSFFQLWH